ncbi:MAG: DUF4368 domain-containing protein [Clostridia bacterium]|nr:DUF4368 domain-containing protein [Clostridia bacterium]
MKIYEDNASGRPSDKRYKMLSAIYEAEQKQLKAEVNDLHQMMEVQEKNQESLEQFIKKIKAYGQIDKLDGYILHDLIRAIYVGAPDWSSGRREQGIHIEYNCVGFIPINGLTEKQTA